MFRVSNLDIRILLIMIVFTSHVPHPPLIVPGISSDVDFKLANKTVEAMDKLSKLIAEKEVETIIVISPHALTHSDRMTIYGSPELKGDFGAFGKNEISFDFSNDLNLVKSINNASQEAGINSFIFRDTDKDYLELDHGTLVPLYYLTKNLPSDVKIVSIAYSYLDRLQHYGFGQVINQVANTPEFKNKKIAIISSGDLSHRLSPGMEKSYPYAQEFDNEVINSIDKKNARQLLEIDEEVVENAGECGYRSLLILFGALENLNYTPEILSYEHPFGIGYLVANFSLESQ